MPTRKAIWSFWSDRLKDEAPEVLQLMHRAYGEDPADLCWSCGASHNERSLERAHLRARSLDGLDIPANLVLLCHPCHKSQPDNGVSSALLWLRRRAFAAANGQFWPGSLPRLVDRDPDDYLIQVTDWLQVCDNESGNHYRGLSEAGQQEFRRMMRETYLCERSAALSLLESFDSRTLVDAS
jgi:hypothetical protein